jgi:hypothetical protein
LHPQWSARSVTSAGPGQQIDERQSCIRRAMLQANPKMLPP